MISPFRPVSCFSVVSLGYVAAASSSGSSSIGSPMGLLLLLTYAS